MQMTIEGFTPYDRSVTWRLHDAYFAQRGIDAWQKNEIPHHSTNNFAVARQVAELLVAAARERGEGPVRVLEVGCGMGRFASNVLRALDTGCGETGRALAGRLVYVLSDYSARSVREAAESRWLAPLVEAGRVVPALYDLNRADPPVELDGAALPEPFDAVLSNYVACVLPSKHLRKKGDDWSELYVEVRGDTDELDITPAGLLEQLVADAARYNLLKNLAFFYDWRAHPLGDIFERAMHGRIAAGVADGMDEATLGYPMGFLDFLTRAPSLLAPDGVVLINDYGSVRPEDLEGLRERRPQVYGNTLNHDVHFRVFDAFAAEHGWGLRRTADPIASLHTAVLRPAGELPLPLAGAFDAIYGARSDGDDVLDFGHIARKCMEAREYGRAARFYRRALALDVDSPLLHYRLGVAYIEGGQFPLAISTLHRGLELVGDDRSLDFEFELGRAYCMAGRLDEAVQWYETSLTREKHPVTFTNLAVLHGKQGRHRAAYRALKQALALDPKNKRAVERMEQLREAWWQTLVASAEAGAPDEAPDA